MLFVEIARYNEPTVASDLFESLIKNLLPSAISVPVVLMTQKHEIKILAHLGMSPKLRRIAREKLELPLSPDSIWSSTTSEFFFRVLNLPCPHVDTGQLHHTVRRTFQLGNKIGQDLGLATFSAGDVKNAEFLSPHQSTSHRLKIPVGHLPQHTVQSDEVLCVSAL